MALDYRQVKDLYDVLKGSGATSVSLPEWSQQMNDMTGTDLYSQGFHDSIFKRASVGIDRALEAIPGLMEGSRQFGQTVGSFVGNPEAGARIGENLPRTTANFAPFLIPGPGWGAGLARLGGAALLSGSDTYTKTDSPAAGILSGVTNAAMPKVADLAEQEVLKRLGGRLVQGSLDTGAGVEAVKRLFPTSAGQTVASNLGGQLAAAGLGEVSGFGQDKLAGNPLHNPFTTENLLNLTLGQAPFAAIHLGGKVLGVKRESQADKLQHAVDQTEHSLRLNAATRAAQEQSPIEQVPVVTSPISQTPEQAAEIQSLLAKSRQAQADILAKTDLTADDGKRLDDLVKSEQALDAPTFTQDSVLGVEQPAEASRFLLAGKQIGESSRSRTVLVADDPANPDEYRGRVINYSKGKFEEPPTPIGETGQHSFAVPRDFHTILPVRETAGVPGTAAQGTPELPQQAQPATGLFDHLTALDRVESSIDAAKTPAQVQKAISDLRAIQEVSGQPQMDDFQLKRVVEKLKGKLNPVTLAIKREVAKTKRNIQAQEDALAREQERQRAAGDVENQPVTQEGIVENRGSMRGDEGGAKAVIGLPKLDADTEAIHNFIDETLSGELARKDAQDSFAQWQKSTTTKDVTSLPIERERFKIFWKLKQEGDIGTDLNLSPKELEVFNNELKSEGIGVADPSVLKDFPERDHVLNWEDSVNERIANQTEHAPAPQEQNNLELFHGTQTEFGVGQKSGYYPGVYTSTKRELAKTFGSRLYKLVINGDKIYRGVEQELKIKAQEAGFGFHSGNGQAEVNYLKSLGYEGLQRGEEVILFAAPKTLEAKELAGENIVTNVPAPREVKPYEPQTDQEGELSQQLTTNGQGLLQHLLASEYSLHNSIAKDLLKNFPDALSRISSSVTESDASYAQRLANRNIKINFDPSVLSESPIARENVILHEVIHGLTLHELNSPAVRPELVTELGDIQQKLVDNLSPRMRKLYDDAVTNKFYEKFSRGEATFQDLASNASDRQILYGLLNHDELVSQAYSSPSFRNYMQSVGGKTQSTWNKFVNWTKNLLGIGEDVKGSVFNDFLSTTSQLMQQGDWLANFSNFGERYFEAQGKGGAYGKGQTQRALGIVADSSYGLSREVLAHTLDAVPGRYNTALVRAKAGLDRMLAVGDESSSQTKNILAELGHASVDDMVTSALSEGKDIGEALDILPQEASKYVYEKLKDSKDVLDVLKAASSEKNKGLVNIADPKLVKGSVTEMGKVVEGLLKNQARQDEAATQLAGLNAVTPDGFYDQLTRNAPKEIEEFIQGTKAGGKGVASWLSRFLEPMGQLARRIPESAEILSKGFQLASNSRKAFSEAMKPFGMDTSSPYMDLLTHESVEQSSKVFGNPKLLSAAEKWIYWNNKKGGDAVQMLPDNDLDVAKVLQGLTPGEKENVTDLVAKQGKSTQAMNAQKLEFMTNIAAVNGAAVIGTDAGGKTRDNVALSDTLLRALLQKDDPTKAVETQAMVQSVQQRIADPEHFLNLLRYTQGEAEKISTMKAYFDANPFWATAQRMERFLIKGFRNGKPINLQASSLKETKDIVEKKGITLREPPIDQWKGREDEPFQYPNMPPEMVARMREIEGNQLQMLKKVLTPDELKAVQESSPVSQILREATASQSIPGTQPPARLLSQGAEELPWMWNHISWAQKEASFWSRQLLRAQARTYLKDPEIAANPKLQADLKTHFDNLLQPDPLVAQKLRQAASTWFLGFNLATSLINASQPFVTHVGELTALSGKPLESYRRVLNSLGEIGGRFVGKKDWATPEHEKLMGDAVRDGEVGTGMFDDEAAAQESIATNYKREMMKNKTQSLGQKLSTLAGAYSTASMWMFQHGERVNSRSAILAGFDYYREQGLSYEDAKQKAYEFNRAVNYSGGRAQRSIGAFSGRGDFPRTAAMLGTSLQSYVLGTTFQLARYLQRGAFRPEGVTPHEVYAARKAAIQMLGTQFAAAGLLGMPFVSSALALLNKAFPDLELNKKLREGIGGILGGDEENGSPLTDIAMTGVPSMLGWDLQSRLSMGNTLPGVSEVNGFQPENLMGPAVNIVRNFVNGVTGWAKGDAKAGMNFIPPAIAKAVQTGTSWLSDSGNIRDYQGRPLANPTLGESLGQALGFQPTRLSQQNAAARMLTQAQEVVTRHESQFRQQQAQEILKGNFGSVQQALRARMTTEKDFDPVESVKAIARATEELNFPRDLRSEGTKGSATARSALLSTYSGVGSPTGEMQRVAFRQKIQQGLGLNADPKEEIRVAQVMDNLKSLNPNWTRSQLRSAAVQMLRHRVSSRTLELPQVGQ